MAVIRIPGNYPSDRIPLRIFDFDPREVVMKRQECVAAFPMVCQQRKELRGSNQLDLLELLWNQRLPKGVLSGENALIVHASATRDHKAAQRVHLQSLWFE